MRKHRHLRFHQALHRGHFVIGNRRQAVPAVFEDAHEAAHLQHFDIRVLVHALADEQVARKHRRWHDVELSLALRPRPHLGKKGREAFAGQLIDDQTLTMTTRPDGVPRVDGVVRRFRNAVAHQGFAPFGWRSSLRNRPSASDHAATVRTLRGQSDRWGSDELISRRLMHKPFTSVFRVN